MTPLDYERGAEPARGAARRPLAVALTDPRAYPEDVAEVRLVETHISWVFLTGRHAYKVKKPIALDFLDFSTLERRKRFCDEELRINRRLAPELYLAVVPIGGTPEAPKVGAEPALEYAVKMREFPDNARLDRRLADHDLTGQLIADFAAKLADFHAALPQIPNRVSPEAEAADVIHAVRANLRALEQVVTGTPLAAELAGVRGWTEESCRELEPTIAARLAGRAQKECHGDLHLENLVIVDEQIVAFDALEFDPVLREVDVISDAGFLAMDLLAHGRADLAFSFLTRYLERGGDYEALDVLRFYMVYRAMVRAKVRAIKAAQAPETSDLARHLGPYFDVARHVITPRKPLLAITHGLSGSGKTHLTDTLIGDLPALRVRSDLERKRLHGLAPEASSGSAVGGGIYDAGASREVYGKLEAIAKGALRNAFDLIVDATFLQSAERERFRLLAGACGARFAIIDCTASLTELRRRVARRAAASQRDASEAEHDVLAYQLEHNEPLSAAERGQTVSVDTEKVIDVAALCARLRSGAD